MGISIIARCPCGFESDSLLVGGGMADIGGKCLAPALSQQTGKLVVRDYWEPRILSRRSSQLIFYNDPELQEKTPVEEDTPNVFSWFGNSVDQSPFYLRDINYLCPDCGEMKLRFMEFGLMWD